MDDSDPYCAQQLHDVHKKVQRQRRHVREIAEQKREWRDGSQGAASDVRVIDPKTCEVVEIVKPAQT
jgi:hypothetical protein